MTEAEATDVERKKEQEGSDPSAAPVATPLFDRPVPHAHTSSDPVTTTNGNHSPTLTAPPSPGPARDGPPTPSRSPEQLLEEARTRQQAAIAAVGKPTVDKYFGSKLPPVCRSLGCYVTDDGKFFYCINPHCHKDKKRETKYNRRKKSVVYFFCPKCKSREIQLHLKANNYECLDCAYSWKH